ncbi:YkvA family protein [Cellulomonas sp. 73-92]|uniref:YkvA family protein n=1 Tax=Cellulomonas sp. 73-92 TaxID=1895740 RepID=UPI00345DFB92
MERVDVDASAVTATGVSRTGGEVTPLACQDEQAEGCRCGAPAGLALCYALWPLDIVPDILGPLGWVDDGAVVLGVLGIAGKLMLSAGTTGSSTIPTAGRK